MLKVFEAFSGIGAQKKALTNANIPHKIVGTSDIDYLPIIAYSSIHCNENMHTYKIKDKKKYLDRIGVVSYPEAVIDKLYVSSRKSKNYGDISSINIKKIPNHDLFTYSFPCQDISSVGKKNGLEKNSGTRSSLLWECEKIIREKKPKYLVMENVRALVTGKNLQNFENWIELLTSIGYKSEWRIMDSKDYGIPQRRPRVIMISKLGNYNIDIFKKNPIEEKTINQIITDKNSINTPFFPKGRMPNIELKNGDLKFLDDRDWKMNGVMISDLCSTQRAGRTGLKVLKKENDKLYERKLSALECCRLMGFDDNDYYSMFSSGLSDTEIMKLCGNSIVVPVLENVFKNIYEDYMIDKKKKNRTINAISLFSNVGIGELYLKDVGVNVVIANELLENRADFYRTVYPECEMISGDIYEKYAELLSKAKKRKCELLIATPPCQGMSVAGKRDYTDTRNQLIIPVLNMIKDLEPNYVLVENVPKLLDLEIEYNNKKDKVKNIIEEEFGSIYKINQKKVLDAKDYGVPQTRKRAIILLSKKGNWEFPNKEAEISLKDAIGDFPSVEAIVDGNPNYFVDNEKKIKKCLEFNKFHYPPKHSYRHVEMMMHTPSGKSAFDNDFYYPKKSTGERVKGFNTTYKRMSWDKPAPTITMANGVLSSQSNVHPGRKMPNGLYSDARVLTIAELMKLFTIPYSWNVPEWASENLVRNVIGEGVPPLLIKKIVAELKIKGSDCDE